MESLIDSKGRWTFKNDVFGCLFGVAPNQIFLPAAGYRDYFNEGYFVAGKLDLVNYSGFYWSSSQYNDTEAQILTVSRNYVGKDNVNRANAI